MSEYTLTLPYHVCMRWGDQCVAACEMDNQCASSCREDHPCGAQNPPRANTTASTTASATSTSTSSPTETFDGLADGTQFGNKNAAGTLRFGSTYGLGVVAAGLFAGFAVLL